MQFLIDSANLAEVEEAFRLPFVQGVTTNTREVAYHRGADLKGYLSELRRIARGTIHIQVTSADTDTMIREGRALTKAVDDIRIKMPVTANGLAAMQVLASEGIEVAATAVNTVAMGVLAAKMGAASVISYFGALADFEEDAGDLLAATKAAFTAYGFPTEVYFFAKNAKQVKMGIQAGADACLMPLAGLKSLLDHPLSTREVEFMNAEWERVYGSIWWDEVV